MQWALLTLLVVQLFLTAFLLYHILTKKTDSGNIRDAVRSEISTSQKELREELANTTRQSIQTMGDSLHTLQKETAQTQSERLTVMREQIVSQQAQSEKTVSRQLQMMEQRLQTLEATNEQKLENIRNTMARQLTVIQEENRNKLDSIEHTVSDKLDSQLTKSFKLVSERLEQVYQSLGEMQSISSGIGDLKKVLSNVKTRGILGEIQLGSILEEILAPEQYAREIPTIPDSRNHVEFAVKLPGVEDDTPVYLPIDSKFPADPYTALQTAYESGEKAQIEAAKKALAAAVKKAAGDIREKYVCPPYTTNFGILFLPFEGLYAEVVNSGLVDTLQREYHITIAGPSTMASMLNSLQMGFRTLAIQKRSNEVWQILTSVKSEFGTFGEVLEKAQKHIRMVDDDLEKLIGTRTKQINKSLDRIELLEEK